MTRYELWVASEWGGSCSKAITIVYTVDVAMEQARKASRAFHDYPVVVLIRERTGVTVKGVAMNGQWLGAMDCPSCKGKGAFACVRCKGAGWKP